MRKLCSLLVVTAACLSVNGAEPVFLESFDQSRGMLPHDVVVQVPGRGNAAHITVATEQASSGRTVALPLPLEKMRGQRVFFGADVKAANVSPKPNSWNGVKVMMIISTPSGRTYPQPEIPAGSFDWRRFATPVAVPGDATNVIMVLGLEKVAGEAWFDNVSVTLRPRLQSTLKVDASRPVFRGHSLPRLRGAMAGNNLTEDDLKHFANAWNGNLLRLQIFESARKDRSLEDYDAWLDERLQYIDRMLEWCEKYHVMAVVDLHSPPGGQAFSAGYITAKGRIFTDPKAQAKFVEVWERMTARYKGRRIIWGFDLVNEPDDSTLSEECLDWNLLADKTARAVRAIDPDRTLIIEPNQWGGAQGFAGFEPLDLTNVVYSFHFYQPHQFTHQGIHQNPAGVTYPGQIGTAFWDKVALEHAMAPAIDFARKYRVHMYVGEFSAIRTAPDNSAANYLSDVITILEKHSFDWSYHAYREWQGWSLEHAGSLEKPVKAASPTDRQKVVTDWFRRNAKPGLSPAF